MKDPAKESAEQKAKRMWSNYDLMKRFLEEKEKPTPIKPEPEIAEVVRTERPRADSVTRFQNKFVKDFKSMLEAHKRRNLLMYKLSLKTQLLRLKREKLRRLEERQAQRDRQLKSKDLFS